MPPAFMRPRLRWSSYARQSQVGEILSLLALAAEEGARLPDILWLTARSPVRPLTAVPGYIVAVLSLLTVLTIAFLSTPYPYCLGALIPGFFLYLALRSAVRHNRVPHQVPLAGSELAHLLADALTRGETLSQAMAGLPRIFTPAQVAAVRAGEEAGALAPALRCLAREASVRQSAQVLNFYRVYPLLALFILGGLADFIVTVIYPKWVDIFNQLGAPLPHSMLDAYRLVTFRVYGFEEALGSLLLLGLLCLWIDHVVRLHLGRFASGVVCAAVVIGLVKVAPLVLTPLLYVFFWWGSWWGRGWVLHFDFDPVSVALLILLGFAAPVIADWVRGLWALAANGFARLVPWRRHRRLALERAGFFESLALMLERRLPAPEALRLAAPTLTSAWLTHAAEGAAAAVERGESLEKALVQMHLLDRRGAAMLSLAIAANDLPGELKRLSAQLSEDARLAIARRERLMRPVVLLVVALFALGVLLAVYVPIFQIAVLTGR